MLILLLILLPVIYFIGYAIFGLIAIIGLSVQSISNKRKEKRKNGNE